MRGQARLADWRWLTWAAGTALVVCPLALKFGFSDGVDRNRVWTVGTDNTLPYHAYLEGPDGQRRPVGIAAELVDAAAKRTGIRLRWVVMPLSGLSLGQADLWPLISNTGRDPWLRVSRAIVRHSFVAVSRNPDWDESKKTPRIATRPGPISTTVKRLYPNAELVLNLDRKAALQSLCAGSIDAQILEARPLQAMLLNRPAACAHAQLHVRGENIPARELGIGSRIEAERVANLLRDEIDRMIEDQSLRDTLKDWAYYSSGELDLIHREEVAKRATQISSALVVLMMLLLAALSWLFIKAREAQREAIDANQAKTDFLANVSHEIRTPLNGILGLAEVLETGELDPRRRDLLRNLLNSGRNLLAIVNDVLDLARVTRGQFVVKPESTALRPLLLDASQPFALAARNKHLEFEMVGVESLPERVQADPVRLRQVFLNLLGNAVKFTDRGSVRVRCQYDANGRWLRLSVEDTGIGMSAAAQSRLFEKFYQADSSISRRFGGTGLGLAIVKEIVTAMGGAVAVESTEGVGSKFSVRLPMELAEAPVETAAESTAVAARVGKSRVLVVEDNEVNQIVVKSFLEMAGHEVDCAVDGVQGVEAWKRHHYDVVLMDCQMPNLDGYQATASIREIEADQRHTPIIALTASAMPGERERCIEAGMDDFLAKPIQAAELQRLVDRWLNQENPIPVRLQ